MSVTFTPIKSWPGYHPTDWCERQILPRMTSDQTSIKLDPNTVVNWTFIERRTGKFLCPRKGTSIRPSGGGRQNHEPPHKVKESFHKRMISLGFGSQCKTKKVSVWVDAQQLRHCSKNSFFYVSFLQFTYFILSFCSYYKIYKFYIFITYEDHFYIYHLQRDKGKGSPFENFKGRPLPERCGVKK